MRRAFMGKLELLGCEVTGAGRLDEALDILGGRRRAEPFPPS
jgi:hypothetical protein